MTFVGITTLTAGWKNIFGLYLPQIYHSETQVQGTVNLLLTAIIMICVVIILANAIPKWRKNRKNKPVVAK
jgi:carbon starvation protein